jgi:hypothetical protein
MPTADEVEVRTLHALARQVLLDAAHAVELVADRLPLLRAARRRAAARREKPRSLRHRCWTPCSRHGSEGRAPPPEAETALAAYESLLAARASLEFDDRLTVAEQLTATVSARRHVSDGGATGGLPAARQAGFNRVLPFRGG